MEKEGVPVEIHTHKTADGDEYLGYAHEPWAVSGYY